jgi:hypothetical protein
VKDGWVSAEELDALFGPGWRHPYCLWPSKRVLDIGTDIKRRVENAPKSKASYPSHLDLAREIQMRLGEEAA